MNYVNDAARDAFRTIAGFVFQVNSTILHWLNLEEGVFLELEAGEDIDIVRADLNQPEDNPERLLMQLKQISDGSLTLRSRDALKSLANFSRHREANPEWNLRFRFVTTLPIGEERDGWDFSSSAIKTWERIRLFDASEEERTGGIAALLSFLSDREKPASFSQATWASLKKMLNGQAAYPFAEFVDTFEWSTGSGDYLDVKRQTLERLERLLPGGSAEAAVHKFDHLFAFVFERLCEPAQKRLDAATLEERLASSEVSPQYLAITQKLSLRLEALEQRVADLESRVDRHDDQLQSQEESLRLLKEAHESSLKTFYPTEEFFASQHPGAALYDLDQQLRGRLGTKQQLDQFLTSDAARIAVVQGSGGIGKTKVLRDWSTGHPEWSTRWTSPNIGVWHPATPNEIPDGRALIVVDDAQRYDDLERLITLVATWPKPQAPKLVVAVRRSDTNRLRQALSRIEEAAISRLPVLEPLSHDDIVALAQEVLGPEWARYAKRLAEVSADSPFITVVGGRLIAQGRVTPDLLNNDREFQRRVFDSLASQYDGNLPSSKYTQSEFMQFIAALQPVNETEDSFIERTASFLGIRNSEVRRGFTSLEMNGVLRRSSKGSSVIPDLLADYLLGLASVEEDGRPTEFADEVFTSFESSHFGNLLKNLAVLDWRITQRDHNSRLLDKIWARLSDRFRRQDAKERLHTLRSLEQVAGYLPERIHQLIRIGMDEPAATSNIYNLYRITHERILEALPSFLGLTIYHETTGQDAFERLWQLAQHNTQAVSNRAQRTLKEAIGYEVDKDLLLNARVLSIVEQFAMKPAAYEGQFTPVDLLEELMVREIDHTENVGSSFVNSVHSINNETVGSLRQRVFRRLEEFLASENLRVAFSAAKSLGTIVSVFIPMRRELPSEEEKTWHDAERNQALDIIQQRINRGALALPTVWRIKRSLQTTADDKRQSAAIRARAQAMLGSLSLPEMFCAFHVLCTDEWVYNTQEDGFYTVSDRRRAEESNAIAELNRKCPAPTDQVRTIESLIRQAVTAGSDPVSVDSFISRLCGDRDFLSAFSEHLTAVSNSKLRQVAGLAIRAWRSTDRIEYLRLARVFISVPNDYMVLSVAREVSCGPALQNVSAEDVEVLSILAGRTEPWILGTIFQALGSLSKPGPFSERARQLVRSVDIGRDSGLADQYCQIVGPGPFRVRASLLDIDTIRAMVAKLVPVYELERHHFGEFVSFVCGIIPLEIVDLLEARLDFAQTMIPDDDQPLYKPIPSPHQWSSLSEVRQSPHYKQALRRLFDLGVRFPDHSVYLDIFFWRYGTLDETTFSVLDEGLHSPDLSSFRRTMSLLCEAQKNIAYSHPGFALHVLTVCEMRDAAWGNTGMDILVNNCITAGGFQVMGPYATPVGAGVSERATPLMDRCEPGSPLRRLYARLASIQPMPIPDFSAELESGEKD